MLINYPNSGNTGCSPHGDSSVRRGRPTERQGDENGGESGRLREAANELDGETAERRCVRRGTQCRRTADRAERPLTGTAIDGRPRSEQSRSERAKGEKRTRSDRGTNEEWPKDKREEQRNDGSADAPETSRRGDETAERRGSEIACSTAGNTVTERFSAAIVRETAEPWGRNLLAANRYRLTASECGIAPSIASDTAERRG